ncbi:hypothetical protein QBC40DRAFT_320517 [Triangularia verruculosa]|uniref:Uncharacterized protein n=1 Tax=Triangularia verruculosa TaxID=2587418 RepID=A0AAN6XRJ4_9PEZI|nr:hypothetical protein QBC40DRAFT_320517 [Triangularia verruculosa]
MSEGDRSAFANGEHDPQDLAQVPSPVSSVSETGSRTSMSNGSTSPTSGTLPTSNGHRNLPDETVVIITPPANASASHSGSHCQHGLPLQLSSQAQAESTATATSGEPRPSTLTQPASSPQITPEPATSNGIPPPPASPAIIASTAGSSPPLTPSVPKTPYGKWRPLYLQKTILMAFVLVFLFLAAMVQLIYWLSYQWNGLQAADESLSWLWTFFPTIILTIINTFWARVAYQSMRYSPWIRLASWAPGQPAEKNSQRKAAQTLLVDYVNMSLPKAVWRALRYGDPLVAAAIVVTVVIWIQITISTGLINLEPMDMGDFPIQILVQDEFIAVPAPSRNLSVQSIPMTTINGMITLNVTLPSGHAPGYAFQQFLSDGGIARDSIWVMQANVKAASVELECEAPSLAQPVSKPDVPDTLFIRFESARYCRSRQFFLAIEAQNSLPIPEGRSYFWMYDDRAACEPGGIGEGQGGKDILFAAVIAVERQGANLRYLSSSQIMCKSRLVVGDVTVKQENGLQPEVIPIGQRDVMTGTNIVAQISDHRLDNERYGSDMQANSGSDYTKELQLSPFRVGASLIRDGQPPNVTEFLESAVLEDVIAAWIKQFGALITHYNYRSPISGAANATASMRENRLIVNNNVAHGMTGGFVLMALLAAWMVYRAPSAAGFIPRDPDTISGSCVVFSKSSDFLENLHGTGSSKLEEVERLLKGTYRTVLRDSPESSLSPTFHIEDHTQSNAQAATASCQSPTNNPQSFVPWSPTGLRLWSRLLGLLATGAILATIVWLLDCSNINNGLLSVSDNSNIQYLWTILPTLFMEALTVYVRGCDFSIRALAPFMALQSRQDPFDRALSVSYTNELGIFTLKRTLKPLNLSVLVSKLIAILALLLPIVSNALFAVEQLETTFSVRLQQVTQFASADYRSVSWQAPSAIGSLLLGKDLNFRFPQWSHEEWAFHTQHLVAEDGHDSLNMTGLTVKARIPAVSVNLDCRLNVTETTSGISADQGINVPHKGANMTCFTELNCQKHKQFAGSLGGSYLSSSCWPALPGPLPDVTNYMWGRCANRKIVFLASLSCTESAVEQDFDVTLHGPDLIMDSGGNSLPIPITESHRPYNFSGDPGHLYDFLDPLNDNPLVDTNPPGALLDRFFGSLINGKLSLPLSDLSSSATADNVIQAIKKQHGIIRAQTLNYDGRSIMANTDAIRVPLTPVPETTAAKATTPEESENRLLQSPRATWILVAVLASMFILTIASMAITTTVQIPKSPGSIASIASLLADSTVFTHLPPMPGGGVQWMGEKELGDCFEKKRVNFRMGWFGQDPPSGRGKYYTIGVVEDEEIPMGNMMTANSPASPGMGARRQGQASGSQIQLVGGAAPMGAAAIRARAPPSSQPGAVP